MLLVTVLFFLWICYCIMIKTKPFADLDFMLEVAGCMGSVCTHEDGDNFPLSDPEDYNTVSPGSSTFSCRPVTQGVREWDCNDYNSSVYYRHPLPKIV